MNADREPNVRRSAQLALPQVTFVSHTQSSCGPSTFSQGFATFAAFGYARVRKFFGLTVWTMFAVTLWLLFVQAFILHAFCRYCLFSAALVFVLAAVVVLTPSSR